ncbi:outer membrane protein assembly factor BamB [Teredinibacter turnerae]|uniref:outer membrane protein assembly factor BamB n=1 Tax=Teredinibacter turnerae TaxID=2426 RepID=UPI00037DB96C|nr:outer membrane protein assembly factor BamB [Teredinibacter turnerae]
MLKRLLLVLAVVALGACSSNDPKKLAMKPADLVKFEATAKLKKQWSRDTGSGTDKRYSRLVPALDRNNKIYTVGVKGDVQALDAKTGKRLWHTSLKTQQGSEDAFVDQQSWVAKLFGGLLFWQEKPQPLQIAGGIAVNNQAVFFGGFDGYVYAVDSENGELLWQAALSSEVAAAPAANSEVVAVNTIDGRVYLLDAKTGEQRWRYDQTVPILTLRGTSAPVLTPTQVIVGFDSGQIVSLATSDGSTQWEVRVSRPQGRTELERIVDIDGTPVVNSGYVYAASYQGNIVALSRAAGRSLWQQEASTAHNIAVADGKVFVSTEESKVIAFNSITGEPEWENFQLKRRDIGGPQEIGDYIAVIDKKGYLHLMNKSDGAFAYRFKPSGDDFRSPMLYANEMLYTFADNGRLTAYALKERAPKKAD